MRLARVAGLLGLFLVMTQAAGAAETLTVDLDQAAVTRLPDRVATIVVGNPLIADVSLQDGGILIVTGKGYGSTNLVALDHAGTVLMEKSVEVRGPRDQVLVVYRGGERETYSCTPTCERRITLGDSAPAFDIAVQQTSTRNGLAQGSSAPPTTGVGRAMPSPGSSSSSSSSGPAPGMVQPGMAPPGMSSSWTPPITTWTPPVAVSTGR